MNPLTPHQHNGSDSPKLVFQEAIENAPQATVAPVTGSAGATYTATEQGIINSTTSSLNDLILKLQNIGILK